MKHFFKEYYELQQAVEDDYNNHLMNLVPDGMLPIKKVYLMTKEVDSLCSTLLSSASDVNLFETRIRLNIARHTLNFYLAQLEEVL